MKRTNRGRFTRLAGMALLAVLLVSALPMTGLSASAAGMKGAFFTSGNPPFAYVITGLRPEDGDNMVKLYQNENMQSYEGYTDVYTIPERAFDADDMRFYTVTEIGGAVGDSVPGALEGVPLRGIALPKTIKTIGARAFSGCTSLTEMTFPTTVTDLASNAFNGVALQRLTLNAAVSTTLLSDTSYTSSGATLPITLPIQFTDLTVSAPLTIAGQISIPGATVMSNTGITIQTGASLALRGPLSGTGVIEVRNDSSLTLEASPVGYNGSIRLTGPLSQLVNHSSSPVTVLNAQGRAVTVQPGQIFSGAEQNDPNDRPVVPDEVLRPKITTNYGGSVTIEEQGKVVLITAFSGYHVEEVVINGLSMGGITRYEFEAASEQNTVAVTFAEGKNPVGPNLPSIDPAEFLDVPAGAAYAEAVAFLANNGILQGVSRTRFAPEQKADRAMFVSVLKRLEIYGSDFHLECKKPVYPVDAVEGAWYADSAAWAAGTNIFPLQQGIFDPGRLITREEAALCLYRYTHARGYDTVIDAGRHHAYRDSNMLAAESRHAMLWAATNGYLKVKGGLLDPAGLVTRADMAQMFALYLRIN